MLLLHEVNIWWSGLKKVHRYHIKAISLIGSPPKTTVLYKNSFHSVYTTSTSSFVDYETLLSKKEIITYYKKELEYLGFRIKPVTPDDVIRVEQLKAYRWSKKPHAFTLAWGWGDVKKQKWKYRIEMRWRKKIPSPFI